MARNLYSPLEAQYILDHAGVLTWAEIAEALGRSARAVQVYASKNGIRGSFRHPRQKSFLGLEPVMCGGLFCENVFTPVRVRNLFCSDDCLQTTYRLKKYNITKERWWEIFRSQGEACICGEKNSASWSVDHDHRCCPYGGSCGDCVRGILCSSCNLGVGQLQDNPVVLRRLADYLESNASSFQKTPAVSLSTEVKE